MGFIEEKSLGAEALNILINMVIGIGRFLVAIIFGNTFFLVAPFALAFNHQLTFILKSQFIQVNCT